MSSNPAAKPTAANLVYELPSILERIDLAQLFVASRPLEVELGCGDASFLAEYAQRHPDRNFIGIERLLGRIRKLDRKGRRLALQNLRGIRIESSYFLEYLLPPRSAQAIHVYFPDPWPKRKHWRHRLINERFPNLARQALCTQGVVYLRTDDAPYFEGMLRVFRESSHFVEVVTPESLVEIKTDFERDFLARGVSTLRAAFQKTP